MRPSPGEMNTMRTALIPCFILSAASASCGDEPGATDAPPSASDSGIPRDANTEMSFFVTSVGNGAAAGNYGGLAGADARCQSLAEAAGAGQRTWRAYLSTDDIGIGEVVDARERIGAGPWFNALGDFVALDVDALHSSGIAEALMRDEYGNEIPRTEHDLLTGSGPDGRVTRWNNNGNEIVATCRNWTSNDRNDWAWVGHTNSGPEAWNDAHESRCNEDGMIGVNGTGRLMCFAID